MSGFAPDNLEKLDPAKLLARLRQASVAVSARRHMHPAEGLSVIPSPADQQSAPPSPVEVLESNWERVRDAARDRISDENKWMGESIQGDNRGWNLYSRHRQATGRPITNSGRGHRASRAY